MTTLLVKNIDYLATFDDARRELKNAALYVRDNVIEAVGTTAELASMQADTVLDLSGHIVMPGMVNVHHHMYQTLTRVMVQDDDAQCALGSVTSLEFTGDQAAFAGYHEPSGSAGSRVAGA